MEKFLLFIVILHALDVIGGALTTKDRVCSINSLKNGNKELKLME